jgi:adhesin HecA-like repeat protein
MAGIGSTGIAGSPTQLADGTDPNIVATVYSDGSVKVRGATLNVAGGTVEGRADFDGATVISSADVLKAILIELRVLTNVMMQAALMTDDPEQLRRDEILAVGGDATNATQ